MLKCVRTTSAGDVLVALVILSARWLLPVADFNSPDTDENTPP